MRLYSLPTAWAQIETDIEAAGGELTPELEARVNALMEGGADALDNAMKLVKGLKAQATAVQEEAQRLQTRASSFNAQAERLRGLILPALQVLGGKVKTDLFSFYTVRTSSVVCALKPGAEVWEMDPRFIRVQPAELNKAELKKAEAAGEPIPDCLAVVKSTSLSLGVR